MAKEITYEITQELGVLSESKSGWTRELKGTSKNIPIEPFSEQYM